MDGTGIVSMLTVLLVPLRFARCSVRLQILFGFRSPRERGGLVLLEWYKIKKAALYGYSVCILCEIAS